MRPASQADVKRALVHDGQVIEDAHPASSCARVASWPFPSPRSTAASEGVIASGTLPGGR